MITSSILLSLSIILNFNLLCTSSRLKDNLRSSHQKHNINLSQLRYLTIGESENPSFSTILSANVTNLSSKLRGLDNSPILASICTNSIIGHDEIYDVIILDFIWNLNGLDVLAQRLRKRFPNAMIILNMMWIPKLILATDANNDVYAFDELWKKYGLTSPMPMSLLKNIINRDNIKFELNAELVKDRLIYLKNIKNSINGHLFGLGQWSSLHWENIEWVLYRLSLFDDPMRYNANGYEFIANGIKEALIKLHPVPSNTIGSLDVQQDYCDLWYNTGKVSTNYHPKTNIKLNEFSTGRFALEILSDIFTAINNHTPHSQQLLLSYVSSGPSDNYPKLEIKTNHAIDTSYIIDPSMQHLPSGYQNHNGIFVITATVDLIPRGRTVVHMKPICQSTCILPFRQVGVSIGNVDTLQTTNFGQKFHLAKPVHLLWGKPEKIVPLHDRKQNNEIRYASFGSSVTWGAGLLDREKDCYVWKLSNLDQERGVNYAIRSSGPSYPASCIRSMMKDEIYDVIILEFFMRSLDGLKTLSKRMRQRFPNAIIIILKLWGPYQFYNDKLQEPDLSQYAIQNGYSTNFIHDDNFIDLLKKNNAQDWKFRYDDHGRDRVVRHHQEAAKDIDAYIVKMPISEFAVGPGGWIELGQKLLSSDSFHLSEAGHQNIADQVKAIVDRVGVSRNNTVKPFQAIDQCYNWFTSGTLGDGVQFSNNGNISKMENTDKYVLSFTNNNPNEDENWIRVNNPTDVELEFLIGYMTTGPPPSKYPKVEATRENGNQYELLPDSLGWKGKVVHIVRMAKLGTVNAHSSAQVTFRSLEVTEYPFRLVQIILTPVSDDDQNADSLTKVGMSDEVSVF